MRILKHGRCRSVVEPHLVDQRRGLLAVGRDLGERHRVGPQRAVASDGLVDRDARTHRILVVDVGVDLLRRRGEADTEGGGGARDEAGRGGRCQGKVGGIPCRNIGRLDALAIGEDNGNSIDTNAISRVSTTPPARHSPAS